jgi:DNA-binding FadR family transcriptional regulator
MAASGGGRLLFGADGRVRHRTQHGHVVDELGLRIVSGEVRPGETFPAEPELCASLGVSRGALREAVKALRAKGMVDLRPGTGTTVRSREEWNFLDRDVLHWQEQTAWTPLVLNLAELRSAVEPAAARLAALRATAADVRDLERACAAMARAASDGGAPEAFNDADVAFHIAVLRASHNDLYLSLGKAIEIVLRASFDHTATVAGAIAATVPSHEELLNAITSRDEDASSNAARKLVEEFLEEFGRTPASRRRSGSTRNGKARGTAKQDE